MALNRSPEFEVVIVQIALVATLFIGPEDKLIGWLFWV